MKEKDHPVSGEKIWILAVPIPLQSEIHQKQEVQGRFTGEERNKEQVS